MQTKITSFINRYVIFIIISSLGQIVFDRIVNYILPDRTFNGNLLNFEWIFGWTWLFANLIMALLIYKDMKRLQKMNWWILAVTLINKEFGALVSLFLYFREDNESK